MTADAPRSEERPTPTLAEVEAELLVMYKSCAHAASIAVDQTSLAALAARLGVALDCVRAMAALESGRIIDVARVIAPPGYVGFRATGMTGTQERKTPLAAILAASVAADSDRSTNDE